MIAKDGLGIAMGNADSEIQQIADQVAPPNYEDGVAIALARLFGLRIARHYQAMVTFSSQYARAFSVAQATMALALAQSQEPAVFEYFK